MYILNKQRASGRKDGYAGISGLADICERPHMRKKPFCTWYRGKMCGFRMGGAMHERGTREAARRLFIQKNSEQAAAKTDMQAYPVLRTFASAVILILFQQILNGMRSQMHINVRHVLGRRLHPVSDPVKHDIAHGIAVISGNIFRSHHGMDPAASGRAIFLEQLEDQTPGAFLHYLRKRVLPGNLPHFHIKFPVPAEISKDQDQGLPVHQVGQQYLDRVENIPAHDPREQVIFILKMVIKSHTDDSGAIRDLLDRYFLKRLFDDELLQTLRKPPLYISAFLQKYNLRPVCRSLPFLFSSRLRHSLPILSFSGIFRRFFRFPVFSAVSFVFRHFCRSFRFPAFSADSFVSTGLRRFLPQSDGILDPGLSVSIPLLPSASLHYTHSAGKCT